MLEFADFNGANLAGANLMRAEAGGADFSGAKLDGANFTMADLQGARFRGAKGVDTIIGLDSTTNRDSAVFE
jgi:uncharacterized protein YjbI with pentapeptide repeats